MKYAVTTAPTVEPVTLADAKVHLRTVTGDTSEDSAIITPLITAAREYCENITGRALAPQTVKAYPHGWGAHPNEWRLPHPPLTAVTSIKYYGTDNAEHTLAAEDYQVDTVDGLINILKEPGLTLRDLNPIVAEYTCGYATAPKPIRQAMLLWIADKYQNRGDDLAEKTDTAIHNLLNQYKVWWA